MSKGIIIVGVVGAGIGLLSFFVTKKEQKKAKKSGKHIPYGPYEVCFKRPLDVILSGAAVVVLSPVLGVTALIIRVKLGKPVLFKQKRPGLNEKLFSIYKFRTMTDARDENGELLSDHNRLTPLGAFLRKTSIDELPELFNVIQSDMSLIGPRPLLVEYLPYYKGSEIHRHDVRPGLSGLAQVNGRNNLNWDDRLAYDVQYVEKITFIGDVKILFKTILKVLKSEDVAFDTETAETWLNRERNKLE